MLSSVSILNEDKVINPRLPVSKDTAKNASSWIEYFVGFY